MPSDKITAETKDVSSTGRRYTKKSKERVGIDTRGIFM
jgi:hypothetical protein